MTGAHTSNRIDRITVENLLRDGLTNTQISERLKCAPNTICMIKKELGFATEARKPAAEWKKPMARKARVRKDVHAREYTTERTHLALMIGEWPAGIHFEDAAVPREPMFRGTPPAFGFSLTGNSSAMAADLLGFV